jgi:integrase
MAKSLNKLSPLTIKSMIKDAKNGGKLIKAPDGGGLYFVAEPDRSSWWRFDYRITGKQKSLSAGIYPEISLADARQKRSELRSQVTKGIDPSLQRKAEKDCKSGADSFELIAREWWEHKKDTWTEGHAQRTLTRLINDVFPYLGKTPINNINAAEILKTIRRIEARGAIETAHRTNQTCESVFAFAIGTSRCENNPATAIRSVLKEAPPQKNFARLKDVGDIANLLRDIDCYKGSFIIQSALKLIPLTFTRPNELASLEWCNIDFENSLWTVPAHIKKQKKAHKEDNVNVHLVPLSTQAMAIIMDIYPLTGNGRYVFTGLRSVSGSKSERPITTESLLGAIRRMGYSKEDMTIHGFRGIASTQIREINKNRFADAIIEVQMSHKVGGKVQQAYDHAVYLPERTELMQWWSDYLDKLKNGAQIIPIRDTAS